MKTVDFTVKKARIKTQVTSIDHSSNIAPLVFGDRHYIPIMKTKAGELWALARVSTPTRGLMTPLLEFHENEKLSVVDHAAKVIKGIKSSWGPRPCFLDTHLLGTSSPKAAGDAAAVLSAAQKAGLNVTPVLHLDSSKAYRSSLLSATEMNKRLMIRLLAEDFVNLACLKKELDEVLKYFGLSPQETDLMIDFRSVSDSGLGAQEINRCVSGLPYQPTWKTLSVAGGSFPSSLKPHAPHTWHSKKRLEWEAWLSATLSLKGRIPTFADYGVRDTSAPAKFGSPAPNIRYTSGASFLFRRHDVLFTDGGSAGIFPICQSLIVLPQFSGAAFSSGDAVIEQTGVSKVKTGNPTSWTAWGMSHHFETAVSEIQSLPAA